MTARVDYFEIGTPDAAGARAFYGGLFGWEVGAPGDQGYAMVDGGAGGLWDTSAASGGSWAVFYVHVDDVHETVRRATDLGATLAIPVIDNGDIVFAHIVDPQGNRFAVWRPKDEPAS